MTGRISVVTLLFALFAAVVLTAASAEEKPAPNLPLKVELRYIFSSRMVMEVGKLASPRATGERINPYVAWLNGLGSKGWILAESRQIPWMKNVKDGKMWLLVRYLDPKTGEPAFEVEYTFLGPDLDIETRRAADERYRKEKRSPSRDDYARIWFECRLEKLNELGEEGWTLLDSSLVSWFRERYRMFNPAFRLKRPGKSPLKAETKSVFVYYSIDREVETGWKPATVGEWIEACKARLDDLGSNGWVPVSSLQCPWMRNAKQKDYATMWLLRRYLDPASGKPALEAEYAFLGPELDAAASRRAAERRGIGYELSEYFGWRVRELNKRGREGWRLAKDSVASWFSERGIFNLAFRLKVAGEQAASASAARPAE
ncbi:MAG: hypothetical protein DRP90_02820 [Planctomycetota bacterium]|nr:MAG: hypothetical protein DRP90_02820 [Planctomycetota bacterium]